MGCGKTRTAIAIAGAAWEMGAVRRVLVVAPTSVVSVWPKELSEVADFPVTCRALLGTKQQRLKMLRELEAFPFEAMEVAVINYESTWRDGIFEALEAFDADLIICDESQRIKTPAARQSKAMHTLGDKARFKLILSGTPVTNAAVDIWSQYRFLDRTVFGDNFYKFRNRYAIMGGFNKKQIVGYKNLDLLVRKEHSIAFRITKEEAVDLPEQTFIERKVALDPKTRALYDQIRKESYAELEGGDTITATTVLTKLLRLQQLAGGFLTTDEGERPELVSTAKLDALSDIIEDCVISGGKKLVIFARFLPEVHAIGQLIDRLFQGTRLKQVAIYGAIKKEDRGPVIRQFQEDPDTMVIVGQIDTLGVGVTLTAADTCVYYSKNFNYATYEQSLSRIHRIGQRNTCTYISLVAERTVDETVDKSLSRKEDMAKVVVDEWREIFHD